MKNECPGSNEFPINNDPYYPTCPVCLGIVVTRKNGVVYSHLRRKEMKKSTVIKSISFRGNVAVDGKFNHVHIEVAADVPSGVRPETVLEDLKTFVARELRKAKGEPVVPSERFRV